MIKIYFDKKIIWYLLSNIYRLIAYYIILQFTDCQVEFIVGGGFDPETELYSPERKCQITLAPLSQTKNTQKSPLALIDNKIYTCGQRGYSSLKLKIYAEVVTLEDG